MASVKDEKVEEEVKGGELLFCGTTAWDLAGKPKPSPEECLASPTRLRPLVGVDIRFVASGCVSSHCVALDVEGRCYTWGRNKMGQLGHGDKVQRDMPTIVAGLARHKIVKAGAGRSHTVVLTDDGQSFAFGWNKHGQLGSGSTKTECESSPVPCQLSEVNDAVCGGDFTVWLTSVEGSSIMTAGLPQYGQLGHGSDNEYNTKENSVKLAYEAQPHPKAIASLSEETIVKVACGTNHSVAVDKKGYVYTWGFGGYGRLGHREQKDEFAPRIVEVFTRHNVLPPDAIVSAGAANSACTAGGGQLYMWGKVKLSSESLMYPRPHMDLSGWNIRCMDSGNTHHFVGADSSCISWGHAQYGELGYGPNGQKSSATPKKVDILEGMHVISVACGNAFSLVVVDRTKNADGLEELEVHDGETAAEVTEAPDEKPAVTRKNSNKKPVKESPKVNKEEITSEDSKKNPVKKTPKVNKRKKAEICSEEEGNSECDESDDEDRVNGKPSSGKKGKNTGKGAVRGKGKPTPGGGSGTGRKGRPRKA